MLLLLLPAAQVLAPALAQQPVAAEPPAAAAPCQAGDLHWSAAEGMDYQRDKVELRGIVITECGTAMRVTARKAEASSLSFDDSTWTLTGAVELRTGQGQLAADHATVRFLDGRLREASAHGEPATFEQQLNASESIRGTELTARGHAQTIDYDLAGGEVRLVGEAWLTDGCNETGGERITYNLLRKRVLAEGPEAGASGGRVQGTIRPACKPARTP
jgi:lipopolysaccharide transport protein LptA